MVQLKKATCQAMACTTGMLGQAHDRRTFSRAADLLPGLHTKHGCVTTISVDAVVSPTRQLTWIMDAPCDFCFALSIHNATCNRHTACSLRCCQLQGQDMAS